VRITPRFHTLSDAPHFVVTCLGVTEQQGLRTEVSAANSGGEVTSALPKGEAGLHLSGSIRGLDLAETGGRARIISIIIDGGFISKRYPDAEQVNVEFAQAAMRARE
jgi:hypothetical protein